MATRARSANRRSVTSPVGRRREASPQEMAERIRELEAAEREAKKAQAKEQRQRQRELADAKKKIAKELQAASRLVQKGEREATRLTTKAEQVEKQAEQVKAKAARQHTIMEENIGRMQAKRSGLETTLNDKMSGIGEARGRAAHVAFAAKMLEEGVIVSVAGATDLSPGAEGRLRGRSPLKTMPFGKAAGSGAEGVLDSSEPWPEAMPFAAASFEDADCMAALRAENKGLAESLDEAKAEIKSLRAALEQAYRAQEAQHCGGACVASQRGPDGVAHGANFAKGGVGLPLGFVGSRQAVASNVALALPLSGRQRTWRCSVAATASPRSLSPCTVAPWPPASAAGGGSPRIQLAASAAACFGALSPASHEASRWQQEAVPAWASAAPPRQRLGSLSPRRHLEHIRGITAVVDPKAAGVERSPSASTAALSPPASFLSASPWSPRSSAQTAPSPSQVGGEPPAPSLLANLRGLALPRKNFGSDFACPSGAPKEPIAVQPFSHHMPGSPSNV
mmetsp:Transcript_36145/g.103992  ORF Transcript_36145/g.103992 Transcript_36145/m.103992 type:complete len:509 (+) Transcript_36145:90-1616(+)|eukprot:CAMPEP_0176042280 /NCGR_PEP_ID=MMETSP0120_2-20121206/20977_1 /TAXON_ID=160619 /ORGANISM="Kryptoperidinium foliaceum, Strain CCMP 1326" /LENGTH=508 /DNA_ID=CAMNT_0017375687 /DNA_START=76 /DNA_END=1602 /DNA_ORIENTATION=+